MTTNEMQTTSLTRRGAAKCGIAYALACMASRKMLAAAMLPLAPGEPGWFCPRPNLYVFPGATARTTVIAVTYSGGQMPPCKICIHAGLRRWSFDIAAGASGVSREHTAVRTFIGRIHGASKAREPLRAVVMEAPDHLLAGQGGTNFWAELFAQGGARERIGSPFVAELLAGNPALGERYQSLSPSGDRELLLNHAAEAIALRARAAGQLDNPEGHGQRLASLLLPDVLRYNPELPQGFTFAFQNGRHPGDNSTPVVNTILNGSPAPVSQAGPVGFLPAFPYFTPVSAAA